MRRFRAVMMIVVVALLVTHVVAVQAAPAPRFSIKLLNPPKHGVLELDVGESYTFYIEVKSDTPFIRAMALTDAYYPGRGVFWNGSDGQAQATEALLELTMTGKASTADLWAVCDWPEPGVCWPEGVAPVGLAVGVRFGGGVVIAERFDFAVVVP